MTHPRTFRFSVWPAPAPGGPSWAGSARTSEHVVHATRFGTPVVARLAGT